MKTHIKSGLRVVGTSACLLMMACSALAQAYEPFNYPVGPPLNSGTGWSGPWTANGAQVVTPGLTYPGLTTSGNALGGTPGSAASRLLQTPVVGAAGTSVVLQALIKSAVPGTPATQATLGNSPGGSGKTFIIGDLPMQDADANKWGMQNDCGRYYSSKLVGANQTAYLVARIDFNVSGANDRMRLWVQTTSTAVPYYTLTPDVNVMCNVNTFSGVFWQTQQNQVVDEIRVDAGYCFPPPANMVAWFPFDETIGPTAINLVPGSGNGTHMNGPTPIAGMVAQALRFDGIDDYVQSPSTALTNIGTGDFSLDAWIRLPTNATNSVVIITDKRASAGIGYNFWVSYKRIGIQLADSSGYTNYTSVPITTLTDGQWHHVAATVSRTNPTGIRFYHNGAPVTAQNNDPTNRQGSLINNSPLRIGATSAGQPSSLFKGDIDELEIFNRALAPCEVLSLFDAGSFGKCK